MKKIFHIYKNKSNIYKSFSNFRKFSFASTCIHLILLYFAHSNTCRSPSIQNHIGLFPVWLRVIIIVSLESVILLFNLAIFNLYLHRHRSCILGCLCSTLVLLRFDHAEIPSPFTIFWHSILGLVTHFVCVLVLDTFQPAFFRSYEVLALEIVFLVRWSDTQGEPQEWVGPSCFNVLLVQ